MYDYRATLIRIIDGDTIELGVDLGFFCSQQRVFRLKGINTPELHDKDPAVRTRAIEARRYLMERLPRTKNGLRIGTFRDAADKYGRMLVEIFVDEVSINRELVERGLAVPFMV